MIVVVSHSDAEILPVLRSDMPVVRRGPVLGLLAQVALLAGLGATVGLSEAAWLAGIAAGTVVSTALTWGLDHSGASGLGPADRVTLGRASLVGCVLALAVDSADRRIPVAILVTLAAVALVLDAVDGAVARRTGTVSPLGARFDMEVDAWLILVLSVYVTPRLGGWVLTIGAMRYAFVAAGWLLPWLAGPLPPRYWRKVVAAVQGVVLTVAAADVLPRLAMSIVLAAALALLVESFGRDVWYLARHRPPGPSTPVARPPLVRSREDDVDVYG
jgi:phosphatidylglycerophosphate synthase